MTKTTLVNYLTSVGSETGILSEALDQAPAFKILMLTESKVNNNQNKSSQALICKSSMRNWTNEYQSLKENGSVSTIAAIKNTERTKPENTVAQPYSIPYLHTDGFLEFITLIVIKYNLVGYRRI